MNDPFHLDRFVDAQQAVYEHVCAELGNGRKTSHWMWFIFPQLRGLGSSEMATYFGIASLDEARAYLSHPVLGPRLRACTRLVNAVQGRSVGQIFGSPDDLKFRSSMTLFAAAASAETLFPAEPLFKDALETYFAGEPDRLTLARL